MLITNRVISAIPLYFVRHAWYRSVLGVRIEGRAAICGGQYLWFFSPGQIRRDGFVIGNHSLINRNCTLDARGPIRIGRNVSISAEVAILTTQHLMDHPDFITETRGVTIGDHAWLGLRATVLP